MINVEWTYPGHQRISAVAFSPSSTFAALATTRLVAIGSTTGTELWRSRIPDSHGWIAISDRSVAYLSNRGHLHVFDSNSGREDWNLELGHWPGWLHASQSCFIAGGWRGYTDICCIDSITGKIVWTYPAKGRRIHSLAILHPGSHLLVAEGDRQVVTHIQLETGRVVAQVKLPGSWIDEYTDLGFSTSAGSWSGLPRCSLFAIEPTLVARLSGESIPPEFVRLPTPLASIGSPNALGRFFYISSAQEVMIETGDSDAAWLRLGTVPQDVRFRPVPGILFPDNSLAIGSTSGHIYYLRKDAIPINSRLRVGKRIMTPLGQSGGLLCVPTTSGELLGVSLA